MLNTKLIIPLVIIGSLVIGALIGYTVANKASLKSTTNNTLPNQTKSGETIFYKQSAIIDGKVIGANNQTLTVQNSKGQSETFPVASNFIISRVVNNQLASPSANIQDAKSDREVFVYLELNNGQYQITNVTQKFNPPSTGAVYGN